jgi:hypothetical protein
MKNQIKTAAGEEKPMVDPVSEMPQEVPEVPAESSVPAETPLPQTEAPVAPEQAAAPKQEGSTFANFEAMKAKIEEADAAIKRNPELASQMYTVDTSTNPLSFTLTINNKQKVAPASLQRPTKKASKILVENFPAEWLKAMGL